MNESVGKPKALLLLKTSEENLLLVKKVNEIMPICGIVWEGLGFGARFRLLWKRKKRLGIFKLIDQVLYLMVRSLLSFCGFYPSIFPSLEKREKERIEKELDFLRVRSVNDPLVFEFIRDRRPELVIVSGTSILSRELIELVKVPIINYHAGITPEYRGVYGAFWALLEGEPHLVGSTIHLIDPGIDTGAILRQASIEIDLLKDTHLSLIEKQFLKGLELVEEVLKEFLNRGELRGYKKQGAKSKLYYHPGFTDLLKFWFKIGIR